MCVFYLVLVPFVAESGAAEVIDGLPDPGEGVQLGEGAPPELVVLLHARVQPPRVGHVRPRFL